MGFKIICENCGEILNIKNGCEWEINCISEIEIYLEIEVGLAEIKCKCGEKIQITY